MQPEDCRKFEGCAAPVCPLDADRLNRSHRRGERVCLYLREHAKPGGIAVLGGVLSGEMYEAIRRAYLDIVARYSHLRRALHKAARTPSKLGRVPSRRAA